MARLHRQRFSRSLRSRRVSRALQEGRGSALVTAHLLCKRLQHQDFDDTAVRPALLSCVQKPFEESTCLQHGAPVGSCQSTIASVMCSNSRMYSRWSSTDKPVPGGPNPRCPRHPSLRNPPPRLQRGYGARNNRGNTSWCRVVRPRRGETQVQRPAQITVFPMESSAGTGQPIGRLAQRSMLAQFLALSQVVRRGLNVVLLAQEVAQPKVQVRDSRATLDGCPGRATATARRVSWLPRGDRAPS